MAVVDEGTCTEGAAKQLGVERLAQGLDAEAGYDTHLPLLPRLALPLAF